MTAFDNADENSNGIRLRHLGWMISMESICLLGSAWFISFASRHISGSSGILIPHLIWVTYTVYGKSFFRLPCEKCYIIESLYSFKKEERMASVTYDHVVKKFGDFTAIQDFNLEIQDEEFLVLVGPSGCGKTTALRCLAGLEELTSGNIYIGDRLVNDVPPKDRDIAMVFQSYALYPHMSVYDNMAFWSQTAQDTERTDPAAG